MPSAKSPSSASELKPPISDTNQRGKWVAPAIIIVSLVFLLMSVGMVLVTKAALNKLPELLKSTAQSDDKPAKLSLGYKTEFRSQIPSSCGFTIGWPTTVQTDEPYKEWVYEEGGIQPEAFQKMAPAAALKKGVMVAVMQFKSADAAFDKTIKVDNQYSLSHSGLVMYCVNNTDNWNLNDFTAYVENLSTDTLTYSLAGGREMWGDLEVQPVRVKGVSNGSWLNAPYFLAVTSGETDYSRLVLLQPWASDQDRITTDTEAIKNSLRNQQMTSVLTLPKR